MVIFSKVATCTSQTDGLYGHPSTHGYLTGLRKADQSTFGSGIVVITYLLAEPLIGNEKRSLP